MFFYNLCVAYQTITTWHQPPMNIKDIDKDRPEEMEA